nr:VENN motif pre-toxin domain-containing protein [Rahnella sikkimica]
MAAGLAGGVAGNSSLAAGAQAGKVAVENNSLALGGTPVQRIGMNHQVLLSSVILSQQIVGRRLGPRMAERTTII